MSEPGPESKPELDFEQYQGLDEPVVVDSLEGKKYLLVDPSGSQVQLSPSAYQLLQAIRHGVTFEELAEQLTKRRRNDNAVHVEQLKEAYANIVSKLGEISKSTDERKLPMMFWVRWRLLPEKWVARLAAPLKVLYSPLVAVVVVLATVAVILQIASGALPLKIEDGAFFPAYFLFLASLLVHEFGHASACARFGARPSDIGFTIYILYPAFYSDVSSAWKLKRWQRVIVDLAGNYLQFAVGTIFIAVYYWTGWAPLLLAFMMMLYGALFSLNPIFKFDGYWIVADALGVTNLAQQPGRIISYLWSRLRRRPTKPLPWPMWLTIVLAVYSVATIFVWSYFLLRLGPILGRRLESFGTLLGGIIDSLSIGQTPETSALQSLFISTLLIFTLCLMLWGACRRFIVPVLEKFAPFGKTQEEKAKAA